MDTDNLTDEQFADMAEAQCSPAAKRIAELERQNTALRERLEKLTCAAEVQATHAESIGMGAQRRLSRKLLSDLANSQADRRGLRPI
jgi:hypothetical protein